MTRDQANTSSDLRTLQSQLQAGFQSGRLRMYEARLSAIEKIEQLVQDNQTLLCEALADDLGRPAQDSLIAEFSVILEEVHTARKNLRSWMKPKRKRMPLLLFPSTGEINPQPFGVTLIIGPWNYPFQLLLAPLVSALAAGNCALLKPSELTPRCARVLSELIPKYFPADLVSVVEGGVETSQQLLDMRWDLIFFTGSTDVGRIVAQAAARHLTPVVLELGGKSPCIVDSTADLEVTARRILWGKLLNSGQTCVAPDYIMTPVENVDQLLQSLETTLAKFYPTGFIRHETFCGIVNQRHFQRLEKIATAHKPQLRIGGKLNNSQRLIEPSFYLLDFEDIQAAPIMDEEIFGPLTPIIAYRNIDEVIAYINSREHPLALYVFSSDNRLISKVESRTRSGSFVVNDAVIQLSTSQLPFGGVGSSGTGAYHGITGFQAFSQHRAILKRSFWLDLSLRYRPYSAWKLWFLKRLLGFRKPRLQ
jgi:acyl-CoA reductase-like NAD-dependent aldehyde dehydrogenase